jgi:hypothetical protein
MEFVQPVYNKDKELQGSSSCNASCITDCELHIATEKCVSDIKCVQKDLWRISVKSMTSRIKLKQTGLHLDIRSKHVEVYDKNLYSAGLKKLSDNVIKITVKGVPLSVDDGEVIKMFKHFDISFTSELKL